MVIASTGQVSFQDLQTEFGGSNPIAINEYYGNATTGYSIGVPDVPNTGSALGLENFRSKAKKSPFACYSCRAVFSDYTGAHFLVRRGSDNVTADVYMTSTGSISRVVEGATTHQGVSGYNTWKGASTVYIQRWYDQSGNNRYMEETDTTRQPTFVSYNTYYGVRFNNSRMRHYFTGSITNFTMIGICNFAYGSAAGYFGIESADGGVFDTLVKEESTYQVLQGSNFFLRTYGSSTVVSGLKSVALAFATNDQRLYMNGTELANQTNKTPVTYTNEHLHMGYRHNVGATGSLYSSEIFEVFYFTSALSASEISSFMSNQTSRFT